MDKNRKLILSGVMAALVCVATFALSIPIPFTTGYIHLGDSMIFLCAVILGARYGALAGGIGSMLADLILGYPQWAIPTFIIKSIMVIIVVAINNDNKNIYKFNKKLFLGMLVAGIWMVIGYYFTYGLMYGNYIIPLSSIPFNILQFVIGMVLSYSILPLFKKIMTIN